MTEIIAGLAIEQYHNSVPAWLSKTSLRAYLDHGPAWWKLAYLDRSIEIPRPAGAKEGLAIDALLTESQADFDRRFAVRPEGIDLRTREGKAWRETVGDRDLLTAEDMAIILDCVAAVRALPQWPIIQRARAQQTIRRQSLTLGLGLQSRPDWLDVDHLIVWDLKKTRDLDSFGRQAIDLGYHLQAAVAQWCLESSDLRAFLVAVEYERGARARCYEIPEIALQDGHRLMVASASEIARRLKANDWRDTAPETPEELPIPVWMLNRMGGGE
jgi:hypothetical protein